MTHHTALGPGSSALHLAHALRSKEISAVELTDACLAAVDARNDRVNAVIWRDDDAARAAARRADERLAAGDPAPFLGIPIPIKDLTRAAGQPCTYGSEGGSDDIVEESDLVVERLIDAGFHLCGRTNSPTGALLVTENRRYGITRNPWNTDRSPGGSSGGAAAAVAAGMFPVAQGSDGGGSIRIPASYTGLVGLKTSRSRIPRRKQEWMGGVVDGVLTRTVADTAAIVDELAGPDPLSWNNTPALQRRYLEELAAEQPPLRIGLMATAPLGIPTDPACSDAALSAAELYESLGHHVEEVVVPTASEELIVHLSVVATAGLVALEGIDWSQVDPHVAMQYEMVTTKMSAADYVRLAGELEKMARRELAPWGRDFDVLLTPTCAIQPPPAGMVLAEQLANPTGDVPEIVVVSAAFTAFANMTGQPAISLPLHWTDDNIPIGVMLTGAPLDEATLLRLAAQAEHAQPWAGRQAPML